LEGRYWNLEGGFDVAVNLSVLVCLGLRQYGADCDCDYS
jgi:hypothetical protein